MTQPSGNAIVARTESARRGDEAMLEVLKSYEGNLAAIMPSHVNAETFIGLAMAYVRRDAYLSQAAAANPLSLVTALRETAALGHVPMKGQCALVAFKSNKPQDNGWAVSCIEEVGGVIQRLFRAGGITAIHADVVRKGGPKEDYCRYQRTSMALPDHRYDEYADPAERGHLAAVYAYASMTGGGFSSVVWMPKGVVLKHRAASKSAQKDGGGNFWGPPWPDEGPWTEDMWLKTGLHKLSTRLPASPEYRWQLVATEAAAASRFAGLPDVPVTAEAGAGGSYIEADWSDAQNGPQGPDGASGEQWPTERRPPDAP